MPRTKTKEKVPIEIAIGRKYRTSSIRAFSLSVPVNDFDEVTGQADNTLHSRGTPCCKCLCLEKVCIGNIGCGGGGGGDRIVVKLGSVFEENTDFTIRRANTQRAAGFPELLSAVATAAGWLRNVPASYLPISPKVGANIGEWQSGAGKSREIVRGQKEKEAKVNAKNRTLEE
ncbi:hypothetical protein M0804_004105 [Polistes exclamans]|nr:hypothetical protein M0804_004105 [Polistes exclamans]